MKYIIGVLGMLLPIFSTAQSPPVKALQIGDKVPDFVINNIYNYPDSSIRLSDLKGKLVILDFWGTWCGGCIQQLPKLDSLQREFAGKIQIILISQEGAKTKSAGSSRIKAFYKNWETENESQIWLPTTLEINNHLIKLFPHIFIPHYAWISGNRKLLSITSSEEVNSHNIFSILNGCRITMPLKPDSFSFHHQN